MSSQELSKEKVGVVLLNLGGPPTIKDVQPFLYNLFSDRDILPIPGGQIAQNIFATIVSHARKQVTQKAYQMIGGGSPIQRLTNVQREALQKRLQEMGLNVPVYVAMRYWHPTTEEAVSQMISDDVTHLIALPLYPQFSYTTTESSLKELRKVLAKRKVNPKLSIVLNYHDHPLYLEALQQRIEAGLLEKPWDCTKDDVTILFSAHSLPKYFIEKTGDIYPDHIHQNASLLMQKYFPKNPWQIAYQSRLGPVEWLQPYTEQAIDQAAEKGLDNILIVPLSFVSDHIETLYEVDELYIPQANRLGIKRCFRMESLNDQPMFIEALANLVCEQLDITSPVPHETL